MSDADKVLEVMSTGCSPVEFTYTNHRYETSVRRVQPISVYFGATAFYTKPQWLLEAWDLDKEAFRDFALARIQTDRQKEAEHGQA